MLNTDQMDQNALKAPSNLQIRVRLVVHYFIFLKKTVKILQLKAL